MEISQYIAIMALTVSLASYLLSVRTNQRTARIEKEEKRRKLLVDLMALQPRLDRIIPMAKAYVAGVSELENNPHAKESVKYMIRTVKNLEEIGKTSFTYLSQSTKLDSLDQQGIEKQLTWIALSHKMLDQIETKLPAMEQISKIARTMENK